MQPLLCEQDFECNGWIVRVVTCRFTFCVYCVIVVVWFHGARQNVLQSMHPTYAHSVGEVIFKKLGSVFLITRCVSKCTL